MLVAIGFTGLSPSDPCQGHLCCHWHHLFITNGRGCIRTLQLSLHCLIALFDLLLLPTITTAACFRHIVSIAQCLPKRRAVRGWREARTDRDSLVTSDPGQRGDVMPSRPLSLGRKGGGRWPLGSGRNGTVTVCEMG